MVEKVAVQMIRTQSYQWLIRTVIYALSAVSAARGLVIYHEIWPTLVLVLLPFSLLLLTERIVQQQGLVIRLTYIGLQAAFVALLYFLARYADFWALLLLPACHAIPRLFHGKLSHMVFLVLVATMFISLWHAEQGVTSLLFSSVYLVAYLMVYLFARIILQLAAAKLDAEQLSQKLSTANQKLRDYAHQSAQDAATLARQKVARDLHDSVTQTLFSVNLMLSTLRVKYAAQQPEFETALAPVQDLAESAMKELRGIISQTQPVTSAPVPLQTRLNKIVDSITQQYPIDIQMRLDEEFNLPSFAIEGVLRFIQEGLLNAAKHAEVAKAEVLLQQQPDTTLIKVCDQGKGFNTKAPQMAGHLGLESIRQHCLEIGAQLNIESEPSKGTCLTLTLPNYHHGGEV